MAAQIIYLILFCIGFGMKVMLHGQPKTGDHNIVIDIFSSGIIMWLLYWGGFFNPLFN